MGRAGGQRRLRSRGKAETHTAWPVRANVKMLPQRRQGKAQASPAHLHPRPCSSGLASRSCPAPQCGAMMSRRGTTNEALWIEASLASKLQDIGHPPPHPKNASSPSKKKKTKKKEKQKARNKTHHAPPNSRLPPSHPSTSLPSLPRSRSRSRSRILYSPAPQTALPPPAPPNGSSNTPARISLPPCRRR
jgi:hypothetical protein